ncbi:Pimeloyl-ACP methyl ester carboxylesterase [Hymenobacter daecheongensis DSM 21074]|uniref:Pimeloyl-ACP methyl ester carboxylesterase n=1 Tax=Hymenobacter daecheongensis DSM 21074 TaxID=1121955 RepID=A0A1M6I1Z5_9BACT|nr:alpha/beta fold hydrolase [Hymenobacter daecheongensis]SHJ28468.1 Pimeloyl-ACP methyl ester carboxylesterase [Hymenobacter daecheongensis DSM 21074]
MKPNLLLLHGALGSAKSVQPLARELAQFCQVHTFSFSGHGGRAVVAGEFSMLHFAQEIQQYISQHSLQAVHVFGFSMGGYAALLSALLVPGPIKSITTLGTKFDWNPETVAAETRLLDPAKIQEKVPQFGEQLAATHAPTPWPEVVTAMAAMLRQLAENPPLTAETLARITIPVQVLVGELDKTAGVDASQRFAGYLPHATVEVIMNTPHPLERVNPDFLAGRIMALISAVA